MVHKSRFLQASNRNLIFRALLDIRPDKPSCDFDEWQINQAIKVIQIKVRRLMMSRRYQTAVIDDFIVRPKIAERKNVFHGDVKIFS